MCTYLQFHQGTYYFRRGVPAVMRHLFPTATGQPRTAWRWSLNVKNREEAKRLLPACVTKTDVWMDQARKAIAAAEREIALAPTDAQLASSQVIADHIQRAGQEAAEFFARQAGADEARAERDADFAQGLELRAARGLEIRRLREAGEGNELLAEMQTGRQVGLLDLFDKYAAIDGRNAKTMAQWRPYVGKLVAFLGNDNSVAVTHSKLVAWRNHLRDVETYRGKRLSPKTVNDSYLGAVSALFVWAKGDGLIDKNPMLEVTKVKVVKSARVRGKAFTAPEVALILGATLCVPASREGEDLRNAKRWCPWLMAYSGARVNEITQLRKEDIYRQDGLMVMRLTPEAGTIKSKSFRLVPLHSHVIEQGFLEFVSNRSDGPLFYDPAKRRSDNAINRQANSLGSKLAAWVRSLGIEGVKPNHAWRNLLASLAVRHHLDPRTTKAIMGHAHTDEHGKYICDYVDVMAADLERLPRFGIAP